MNPKVEAEYKAALRALMSKASPLVGPDQRSIYGSTDYSKSSHIRGSCREDGSGCEWVIEPGLIITESDHYEFAGTDASTELTTALEAQGVNCKCGLLTNETIRVDTTLQEVLAQVVGITNRTETL